MAARPLFTSNLRCNLHNNELRRVELMLEHLHRMLHALTETVAEIAHKLACGDMTPEETAQVVNRLNATAAKLAGISKTPMPPADDSVQ